MPLVPGDETVTQATVDRETSQRTLDITTGRASRRAALAVRFSDRLERRKVGVLCRFDGAGIARAAERAGEVTVVLERQGEVAMHLQGHPIVGAVHMRK